MFALETRQGEARDHIRQLTQLAADLDTATCTPVSERIAADKQAAVMARQHAQQQLDHVQREITQREQQTTTAIDAARDTAQRLQHEHTTRDDRLPRARNVLGLYAIISNMKFDESRCDHTRTRGTIHLPHSKQIRSFTVPVASPSSIEAINAADSLWNIIESDTIAAAAAANDAPIVA